MWPYKPSRVVEPGIILKDIYVRKDNVRPIFYESFQTVFGSDSSDSSKSTSIYFAFRCHKEASREIPGFFFVE